MPYEFWIIAIVVAVVIVGYLTIVADRNDARNRNTWNILAQGKYKSATYLPRPRNGWAKTIIELEDGKTYVFLDHRDIPFPRGTMIVISENGLGERKFKEAESPN